VRSVFFAAALLGAAASADVPAGYTALPDGAGADMTKAVYTPSGSNWEVRTGPAHILYAAKDTATGVYAANATIVQLEKPRHPEAYGIFIGGKALSDPSQQTYTYFVVRGTGEYLVKVRTGSKTTTVTDWTASPNVPKEDASGKATYTLKVHVAPNAIHFIVNGSPVAEVPKTGNPTDGVTGLRINHNLHLMVTPLTITR
jgi:hypothetical protein